MTALQVVRGVFRAVLVVVLVASGMYLLVYLYRWEWNRAMISGLFFVIAEIALATATIGRRLGRVERALDDGLSAERSAADDDGATVVAFPWLEPGSFGVFIPVLLGVGAILSALAYVVERIAAATSGEGRSAGSPPLALPPGGLRSATAFPGVSSPPTSRTRGGGVAAVVVTITAITAIVLVLSAIAMYRADPPSSTGSTTFVLEVDARTGPTNAGAIAETLWSTCKAHLPHGAALAGIRAPEASDVAVMVVRPEVGRNDSRRFAGCLEDSGSTRSSPTSTASSR